MVWMGLEGVRGFGEGSWVGDRRVWRMSVLFHVHGGEHTIVSIAVKRKGIVCPGDSQEFRERWLVVNKSAWCIHVCSTVTITVSLSKIRCP